MIAVPALSSVLKHTALHLYCVWKIDYSFNKQTSLEPPELGRRGGGGLRGAGWSAAEGEVASFPTSGQR